MAKVLHIVENFNGQATEKWLYQLYKELKKNNNGDEWAFFCTLENPGQYSHQLVEMDAKVFCSPNPVSQLIPFMKFLRQTLRDGQYDIIHCHHDLMSAIYLLASLGLPVRKRIVHIHNTSLVLPTPNRLKAFIFKRLFKVICALLADDIVGVSEAALKSFLNGKKQTRQFSVIHCSINIDNINEVDLCNAEFRKQHGIHESAKILLFVGRMNAYKNPAFVLEILGILQQEKFDVYGIFVGEGVEKQLILNLAAKNGMSERVKCLGWRNDVQKIMAASDVLIFPSLESPMEGLGLTVVEAQSVGLPVMMSLSVPEEAIVISELAVRLSLKHGVKTWANQIINLFAMKVSSDFEECKNVILRSSFSPELSLSALINVYENKIL